jgi:hypothetical protein
MTTFVQTRISRLRRSDTTVRVAEKETQKSASGSK